MVEDAPRERDLSLVESLWERLLRACRWVYEVFRGYTWSRHLDQREK